ncbi:MAG: PglZ domain-containing protein, partial [Spirochaetales bacterium]|nr:PglZ domain-containing protein [Spirochaetales bacterium]
LEQEYISKPAQTLAGEVVKAMLDGLAYGKHHTLLELVYNNWLDSLSYRESLFRYLNSYSLPSDVDLLSVSPSHPFQTVDEKWLKEVGKNLSSKDTLAHFMERVILRIKNKQAQAFGISFWTDVRILIEFDTKDITYISTFEDCIEFYTNHFYKLDTAIRNLYTEFLNKRDLLEPFQEYYKQILSVFLDKWFKYFDSCKENQTGILQQIIDDNSTKTAIIVGDGVAYEVACQIAAKVNKSFKLLQDTIIVDIPSETENNMSRIYMANAVMEKIQKKREKYLLEQNSDISIDFIKLDEVNEDARSAQFLICTYKDIDDMGEKLQQKALKYFQETIDYFAEKVSQLLNSGYSKVYLISDHGFVLTGLLSESDKISVSVEGSAEKAERYIRTMERQPSLTGSYIGVEKKTKDFNFLYFSKNMNPFKTPGVYGFSHGGVTPQELVTPYFCWEHTSDSTNLLTVTFENKEDLQSVTGELFQIKIKSGKGDGGLFSEKRKVFLIFFSNNVQVNKSDIFEVEKNQLIIKEYSFDGNPEIEVQLLDAESRELLDKTTIKQNKARD